MMRAKVVFRQLATCWAAACLVLSAQPKYPTPRFDFKGKLLLVACDTDMVPSAYLDGKLGPPAGPDVLSVIRLDGVRLPMPVSTVEVTNSVTGPPAAVAVTPDGRYAIVVETQGHRTSASPDATMKDLAAGRKITVVDVADPDKPKIAQQLDSYERAVSVSINKAGTQVAIAFAPKTKVQQPPVVIYQLRDGRLSNPVEPVLPGFENEDQLVDVEFVPNQDALAVLYTTVGHPRLSFLRFSTPNGKLVPWGNTVDLDRSPFLVRFTPDGRFAIVNSMYGIDVRGTLTSIQIGTGGEGQAQHTIVSHTEAGELPEGLAISPDGKWIATANLESSAYPVTDPHQRFFASVSLLHLDPARGIMHRAGEFAFDGMLPEPIVFDNSSRFIAAGSFTHFDDPKAGGSINFWRIVDNNDEPDRVELVKLNDTVPLARGPQSMAIVR